MPDYWCSWWSDEEHPEASFEWWKTGTRHDPPLVSCVAAVTASDEQAAADIVRAVFTDAVANGRFVSALPCASPPASHYFPIGTGSGTSGQWWPLE